MVKYQLWDMVSYGDGESMVPFSVINESDNFENIYGKFKNQKDPCVILIKEDEIEKNNDHCHYSGLPSVKSYNKIYESPDGGKTVYQREEGDL